MGALLGGLLKLLAGDAGVTIGRGLSIAAMIAAIVPVVTVAIGHKDEIAVELTWGQLALFAGFAWAIVEVARRSRPPSSGPQILALAVLCAGALLAPAEPAIAAAAGDDALERIRELVRLVAWLQAGGLVALLWFVHFLWKLERRVYTLELNAGIRARSPERS